MSAAHAAGKPKHPLAKGTRVRTLQGEADEDFDGNIRETPPGAIGTITGIARSRQDGSPGFAYDLEFTSTGAWLVLDDSDLDDPKRYEMVPKG